MNSKAKEILTYGVCGVLAAVLNLAVFAILADVICINYLISTVIAWVCSTSFAFYTNKFFVFQSRSLKMDVVLSEARNFLGSRCISGIIDVGGMYLLASVVGLHHDFAKVLVLIFIVINNYVLSKFWVFKQRRGFDA